MLEANFALGAKVSIGKINARDSWSQRWKILNLIAD